MDKKQNDLIAELTSGLEPVKPLMSAEKRMLLWSLLSFSLVFGGLYYLQPITTDESIYRLSNIYLFLEFALAFLPFLMCGFLVFLLGVPGRSPATKWVYTALMPAIGFVGFVFIEKYSGAHASSEFMGYRYYCSKEVVYFSLIPLLTITALALRTYVFKPLLTGSLIALSGVSLPLAIMQISCVGDPDHTIQYHLMPLLPVVIGGAIVSTLLLKKFSKS